MKAFYRLFYYISILLSCILAGVTIAGAFSGTASPDSFKFMPFIGLGLPILLLVNLASAVYWTIRWRCWVFIPLIAIFSNWGYINCVLQFPLLDPASKPTVKVNAYTPGVLTVATYNVDGFNREHTGYSCKEIAAQMRNLKADILCFQEFGIDDEFGVDSLCTVDAPPLRSPTACMRTSGNVQYKLILSINWCLPPPILLLSAVTSTHSLLLTFTTP